MTVGTRYVGRLKGLLGEAESLLEGTQADELPRDADHDAMCNAWLTAVGNIVFQLVREPASPYRRVIDYGGAAPGSSLYRLRLVAAIVEQLLVDMEQGLVASVVEQARAEAFDDFLDHAQSYADGDRMMEASVIAGVVFEANLRRVHRKLIGDDKGIKLDILIAALAKLGKLTALDAKRARTAAHVRNKATHAQWNELNMGGVKETIAFARELLRTHLDA